MMIWVRLMLLVLVAVTFAGCEIVGGIFKAGAFVGALAIIVVVGAVAFIAMKIRG